jgi:hypothetical protein
MAKNNDTKTITQTMKLRSPKKGSVLYDSTDQNPLFQSVYLMRKAAEELLGISDLDKVQAIEISVKAVV